MVQIAYGHLFFIGVAAFFMRARLVSVMVAKTRVCIWVAVAMFVISLIIDFSGRSEILALSTTCLLVCATLSNARWLTKPLTARPMLFLGSISYSIYLIHILVLHVLNDFELLPASGLGNFGIVFGSRFVSR